MNKDEATKILEEGVRIYKKQLEDNCEPRLVERLKVMLDLLIDVAQLQAKISV